MPHFLEKCLELKCTLESQPDAPVHHQIGVSVQEHPWSPSGLGGAEAVVTVNAEHRAVVLAHLQYNK